MSTASILVVDDEPEIRGILQEILQDENYRVLTAENAARAREVYKRERPDLVLLDIWMPDLDGISLLKEWMQPGLHRAAVVMMSGHGTVDTAVEAVHLGARDFIEKPLSTGRLLSTVARVLADNARAQPTYVGRAATSTLVGKNVLIRNLRAQIERAAQHEAPVLFTGEFGAGKSVAARYLHARSAQQSGPLIEVNLGALAPDEMPAALFGEDNNGGALRDARGGTLLLKEVGELDPASQTRLVQALAEPQFSSPNLRTIATTSMDLRERSAQGLFREDLYYRLNMVPLRVPALREHRDDIPELVQMFVDRLAEAEGLHYRRFAIAALNALRNHHWPGNVRELKNLVRRLLILATQSEVDVAEVEQALKADAVSGNEALPEGWFTLPLRAARDRFEKAYLEHHLKRTGGNVSEVAHFVEMERTHLYRKLKGLGINPKSSKDD